MALTLIDIETQPIYEVIAGEIVGTDDDWAVLEFSSANPNVAPVRFRVLMSDLDLGGATVEDMRTAIEAAGPQEIEAAIIVSQFLTIEVGDFVLAGQAVALRRAARLVAGVGSFALTGQNVTLT